VPPRTVANSDKEKIRLKQTTNPESTNPALAPTVNARTWQPNPNPSPPQAIFNNRILTFLMAIRMSSDPIPP
jgi:hypothetical protein